MRVAASGYPRILSARLVSGAGSVREAWARAATSPRRGESPGSSKFQAAPAPVAGDLFLVSSLLLLLWLD